MKAIRKIAGAELRYLFYSPVAWFVILVFYVLAAFHFFGYLQKLALDLDTRMDLVPNYIGDHNGLFTYMHGKVFTPVANYFYLFLPLLTMGVINRENTSGSIRLLHSSPVKTHEIILGKFLGMSYFNMILLFALGVLLGTYAQVAHNPEIIPLFSVLLGMFFLLSTYTAIGLFISCLTNYQMVAAVLTIAVFWVLSNIAQLWQEYDLARDITYYLSFGDKANNMFIGLISTKDIIYFILIVSMFLAWAIIKVQSQQESLRWTNTASKYLFVFFAIVMLGYLSSRPGKIAYWDLTENKRNTLHPAAQKVLGKLDGSPLKVTLYTNLLTRSMPAGSPKNRNNYIWSFWNQYLRFYPHIEFDYKYYYALSPSDRSLLIKYPGKTVDEIASLQAEFFGLNKDLFQKHTALNKDSLLQAEDFETFIELSYKSRSAVLRLPAYGASWPSQSNVAGTIMRMIRAEDVAITFLTGHFERDPFSKIPRHYARNTTDKVNHYALINSGVDIDTTSVVDKDLPANTRLLVIADPRSPYSDVELERINRYIQKGGNALILGEPGKEQLLNPVLNPLGITINSGIIVSPNKETLPNTFATSLSHAGNFLSLEFAWYQWYGIMGGDVYHDGAAHLSAIEVDGFKTEAIIVKPGNDITWIEKGQTKFDSTVCTFSEQEGDLKLPAYNIAYKLTRQINGKDQRIIVAGDADILSGKMIKPNDFNHAFYDWGLDNKYPIFTINSMPKDRLLKIDHTSTYFMRSIYIYILPAFIAIAAMIILLRRNRK